MARKLIVEIVGDSKSYERALGRSSKATKRFEGSIKSSATNVTASVGTFVKGAVIFGGVQAAFRGISSAVRAGASEFSQMQQVAAQTQAVLKSTGGAANVTAGDVDVLARRLSLLSGTDDEAIASAQNLILTFRNVRNELGEGNQIFDRATLAALDLSKAAGGAFGDLPTTAKQLAKALNDPIRGMTALGRAGVTFSASQREVIKRLVESGQTLDAQKVILREVEKQVGGSAKAYGETFPGQLAKVREAFRNVFGNLVAVVAKPLAGALGAFANFIPRIEQGTARLGDVLGPVFGDVVASVRASLPEVLRTFQSVFGPIKTFVGPIIRDVANLIRESVTNIVSVLDANREELTTIFTNLGTAIKNIWTIAKPTLVFLFKTALPAALRIVIPIIAKVTKIIKFQSEVIVAAVSLILKALDKLLGGFSALAGAGNALLPGNPFGNAQRKIDTFRESIRGTVRDLEGLDGKRVDIAIVTTHETRGRGGIPGGSPDEPPDKPGPRKRAAAETARNGQAVIDRITRQSSAQKSLNQELSDSERRAAHLRDLIRADPANLRLQQRLSDEIKKQVGLSNEIADSERERAENAREAAKQARIARREREAERAENRRDAAKAAQFKALGLTAEGLKPTPGSGSLLKRALSMQERLKGTALDTKKNRSQLRTIVEFLRKNFKKAGKDVREAILGMLNDIAGAGDAAKTGPLTKGSGLNTRKILEGMGLSPEEERELRARLSHVSSAGRVIGRQGRGNRPTGRGVGFGDNPPIIVQSHVYIDGREVTSTVTKQQQKDRRRNPKQKRGPQRHGV